MKAKMDEIDEIWAIYKINLGQNSCWNINLSLKINFGRWIKNWEQSGCWIARLPLESHLGRWINTDVIWAVRSCCTDILSPEAIFSKNLNANNINSII